MALNNYIPLSLVHSITNDLQTAFPAFSDEEISASIVLLDARSKNMGLSLNEYMQRYHPDGLAALDENLPEEHRGYVHFLGGNSAAIIEAGKSADFTTFVHESAHIFRRQLTGDLKAKAERAFQVDGGKWTVEQEEIFAQGLEEYIRTRIETNIDKRDVFLKGSEFVQDVYEGMSHVVDLTPEMEAVYNSLFFASDADQNISGDEITSENELKNYKVEYANDLFEILPAYTDREAVEKIIRRLDESRKDIFFKLSELDDDFDTVKDIDWRTLLEGPEGQMIPEDEEYQAEQILYQTNIKQMMLNFGDTEIETEKAIVRETPEQDEVKAGELTDESQEEADNNTNSENEEKDEEETGDESIATPVYQFEPKQVDDRIFDYTAMPANRIYLVSQREILTKDRPSWIPPLDERHLVNCKFIPLFERDGSNYRIYKDDYASESYIVTPEIFAATINYYVKREKTVKQVSVKRFNDDRKEHTQKQLLTEPEGSQRIRMQEIIDGKHDTKARRTTIMSRNRMTYDQLDVYKKKGMNKRQAFDDYIGIRKALDQKTTDMQAQLEDYRSAYTKGADTSYGDSGTNPALLEQYGVLVKRQNGDAISEDEITELEGAFTGINKVFGDLKDISSSYGLKISHAGEMNMHARKAVGLFHDAYHAIGVSFGNKKDASLILAHEYAHFLDSQAGKEQHYFFASDSSNTPESEIAGIFREGMNKDLRTVNSGYLNRTCECFARAMEQYTAMQIAPEEYIEYTNRTSYCNDETFKTSIVPVIEKLFTERTATWHPHMAVQTEKEQDKTEQTEPEEIASEKETGTETAKTPDDQGIAKYLSLGGKEWTAEGKHRIYFNGKALKALYGLETKGAKELAPGAIVTYKSRYGVKYLPRYPLEATLHGDELDTQRAFEILLSRPYYDVTEGKFYGLRAETVEQYLKNRRSLITEIKQDRENGRPTNTTVEDDEHELQRLDELEKKNNALMGIEEKPEEEQEAGQKPAEQPEAEKQDDSPENEEAAIHGIVQDIRITNYLEKAFELSLKTERFKLDPARALNDLGEFIDYETRTAIFDDLKNNRGWFPTSEKVRSNVAREFITYISAEDDKTIQLSTDGEWRIHTTHSINSDYTINEMFAATDTAKRERHVSYFYDSLEEAIAGAETLTELLQQQKEQSKQLNSGNVTPQATTENALEYNESGVVTSPPGETVSSQNRNGP